MPWRVWASDLLSGASRVYGVVALGLTLAAIVTAIVGAHVATPWLAVAAMGLLVVVVFLAYVRAAAQRDARPSEDELRARIAELEKRPRVGVKDDGTPYIEIPD